MRKNQIYPFWELNKSGSTPARPKLPKRFRAKGNLQDRIQKSIKVDKKTGEYQLR